MNVHFIKKGRYAMANKHLAIYLNDHLAGATGALELLMHLKAANADTPVGTALTELHTEIEGERQELEHLMERLHIAVSIPRTVSPMAPCAYLKGWRG